MSAFEYSQIQQTNQHSNDIGINYIIVSPIESYLPKDYVKMILDESYCQIDLEKSAFILHKKNEDIESTDESNIYHVGIMKVIRWHDTDMANQVVDHLICDMPYQMSEYGWTVEKYDPSDSDDEALEGVDMEFLENSDNMSGNMSDNMSDNMFDNMSDNISGDEQYDIEEFDD